MEKKQAKFHPKLPGNQFKDEPSSSLAVIATVVETFPTLVTQQHGLELGALLSLLLGPPVPCPLPL